MKKIKIHIKSADISKERTKRIKEFYDAPSKKSKAAETKRVETRKNAIDNLIFAVGAIVAEIVVLLIVSKFGIPPGLIRIGFLIFLIGGISLILRALIASIIGFCALLSLRNNKAPEQPNLWSETSEEAITTFFQVILTDNGKVDFDEDSIQITYEILLEMIPNFTSVLKEFKGYLFDFRKTFREHIDSGYKEVFDKSTPPDIYKSEISYDFAELEKTDSEKYMSKTRIKVTYFTPESNVDAGYVVFDINLELLLINSGKFWSVADPMPAYTFIESESAENEIKL
ncbi:MAG: PspC domain-containing protein [Ruminococcus sp.]|jgi:hypothetical protein|nr:PspC domain-containing protein [Ruminococcus sp.]